MKQKRLFIRVLALVLTALLVLGVVVSALLSASAEEQTSARDLYEIDIVMLEDQQALQITQRLTYTNRTGEFLDRVMFALYANCLRRESALFYDADSLFRCFPQGYAPGGIEFSEILVDGAQADWALSGENELFLRVACSLEAGESCVFSFSYHLLLPETAAFLGVGETDWRLINFYPLALKYEYGEFVQPQPNQMSEYVYADSADYSVTLSLPTRYLCVAPGDVLAQTVEGETQVLQIAASGLHSFSMALGMRYRLEEGASDLGTRVLVYGNDRSGVSKTLSYALRALNLYESWFGPLGDALCFAQSDYALSFLVNERLILLHEDLFSDSDALMRAICLGILKQYFGYRAYHMPTEDAWMTDSLSEYLYCLGIEALDGHERYLTLLNEEYVPSVQYTIPGNLYITSDVALFSPSEYEEVVIKRGCLVFHEVVTAMGQEAFLDALSIYLEKGRDGRVLGEYDLVDALDEATGQSWEAFLTDWLFNIGEYANQTIDWLE